MQDASPQEVRDFFMTESDVPPPEFVPFSGSALLTPYGQTGHQSDNQLIVASMGFSYTQYIRRFGVFLYQPELQVKTHIVFYSESNTAQNYWIVYQNDRPVLTGETKLSVPYQQSLGQKATYYRGIWPILSQDCMHFMMPCNKTPAMPGSPARPYGSWFSFSAATNNLTRIVNIAANNGPNMPVLGSYFMVNFAQEFDAKVFDGTLDSGVPPGVPRWENSLVTQQDLNLLMSKGDAVSTPASEAEIGAVLPGFKARPSLADLPDNWKKPANPYKTGLPYWSETVEIVGATLGEYADPFFTRIYYDSAKKRQRSAFTGWPDRPPVADPYDYRQDTVLYDDYFNNVSYHWNAVNASWEFKNCVPVKGIGYPRPNFPERIGASVLGMITGNPAFGLAPGEQLFITSGYMSRKTEQGDYRSAFIDWWREDMTGVFFIEAETSTPPQHALSLIDYIDFVRDLSLPDNAFEDPCADADCDSSDLKDPGGPRDSVW